MRPQSRLPFSFALAAFLAVLAPDVKAIAAALGAMTVERPGYAPGYAVFTAPAGAGNGLALADALRQRAGVESAEPLLARTVAKRFTPDDPFFSDNAANAGYQWHLKNQTPAAASREPRAARGHLYQHS